MGALQDIAQAVRYTLININGASVNEQSVEGGTKFDVQIGDDNVTVNVGSGSAESETSE